MALPQERCTPTLIDLPNHLLDVILSSLPTEVAASTTVLSRDWRDQWTVITSLDLDENRMLSSSTLEKPYSYEQDPDVEFELQCMRMEKIAGIMDRYMKLHEDRIKRFSLRFSITNEFFDSLLDLWLQYAVAHGVKELRIDLQASRWGDMDHRYQLCRSLFSCRSNVEILKLRNCTIDTSSNLHTLGNLKRVFLEDVHTSGVIIRALLHQCEHLSLKNVFISGSLGSAERQIVVSNIRNLSIIDCSESWLEGYEIYAPNLEKFAFRGDMVNFSLKRVPKLEAASILINEQLGHNSRLIRVLNEVSHVEFFSLGFFINHSGYFLAEDQPQEEVSLEPFPYLRQLIVLTGIENGHKPIIDFMRANAPRLEKYDEYHELMLRLKYREERWQQFLLREFI